MRLGELFAVRHTSNLYVSCGFSCFGGGTRIKKRYQIFALQVCGLQKHDLLENMAPKQVKIISHVGNTKDANHNVLTKKVGSVPFHIVDPLDVTIKMPCLSHHFVTKANVILLDALKTVPTQGGKRKISAINTSTEQRSKQAKIEPVVVTKDVQHSGQPYVVDVDTENVQNVTNSNVTIDTKMNELLAIVKNNNRGLAQIWLKIERIEQTQQQQLLQLRSQQQPQQFQPHRFQAQPHLTYFPPIADQARFSASQHYAPVNSNSNSFASNSANDFNFKYPDC